MHFVLVSQGDNIAKKKLNEKSLNIHKINTFLATLQQRKNTMPLE